MNGQIDIGGGTQTPPSIGGSETTRTNTFLIIQVLFLLVSPLTGGFHYKMWSMLDTALLIASIGITALVPVMETQRGRSLVLKLAIVLYVLAIIDMSVNVLISGWVGWNPPHLD